MAKRKKRLNKKTEPRAPAVTVERKQKGDIVHRPDGGVMAVDWVARLAERRYINMQDLSAFRAFEQLQYNITQSGGSIDYEKPRVQTSGAGDIFTDVLIDSSKKLSEIYECVGAGNYAILSRIIGAKFSSDVAFLAKRNQDRESMAVNAINSLAVYYSTKRRLRIKKAA